MQNDKVICPNCVHEFRAIPVDVQEELSALRAENEKLRASVIEECAEALDKEAKDWSFNGYKLEAATTRDCAVLLRALASKRKENNAERATTD